MSTTGDRGWLPSEAASSSAKLSAPAAAKNREPILAVLREVVAAIEPAPAKALELGSGSGEHAIAFARTFPTIQWQPSERDPAGIASIKAWRDEAGHGNLGEPLELDLLDPAWPTRVAGPFDLMVAVNVLHISPAATTRGLISGAAALLSDQGRLVIYGPFIRAGDYVSEGNRDFDRSLRARDPDWGLRDTDLVAGEAQMSGLIVERVIAMPANNTVLVIRRGAR